MSPGRVKTSPQTLAERPLWRMPTVAFGSRVACHLISGGAALVRRADISNVRMTVPFHPQKQIRSHPVAY
jgi:hypothetical protein